MDNDNDMIIYNYCVDNGLCKNSFRGFSALAMRSPTYFSTIKELGMSLSPDSLFRLRFNINDKVAKGVLSPPLSLSEFDEFLVELAMSRRAGKLVAATGTHIAATGVLPRSPVAAQ